MILPTLVDFGFAIANGTILMETVELRLSRSFGQTLAFGVRMIPEVGEQDEEDDSVNPDEVDADGELVVAAGHEVVLGDVDGDNHELQLGAEADNRLLGQGSTENIQLHSPPPPKQVENLRGCQFNRRKQKKGDQQMLNLVLPFLATRSHVREWSRGMKTVLHTKGLGVLHHFRG